MKKLIRNLVAACHCLLVLNSCCDQRDQVYWFPDEAVRYYNEHDTVKFYCPENDVFKTYIVCERDTSVDIDQFPDTFCEYAVFRYMLSYRLYLDSCGSSNLIMVTINNLRPGHITTTIYNPDISDGSFHADFDESPKNIIDVLGHTYHNVIEIPENDSSEIPSILFSYEYGVLQIKYENQTFSLLNDEN